MTIELGELVGRGRTSNVYALGPDSVVKVPHADVPASWPAFEAAITSAVNAHGVTAPQVRDVLQVQGRPSVVFERINGPSMWQQMLSEPAKAGELTDTFVDIQRSLLNAGIPSGVPDLVDRLVLKIAAAPILSQAEKDEAIALVHGLPRGAALLHGDLHPGNILMSKSGPVVIDWFDGSIGHPTADIIRSSVLLQADRSVELRHLPGAEPALLGVVHERYLRGFDAELHASAPELLLWQAVVAAGRLAEHAEQDETGLLKLWHARNGASSTDALVSS